MQMFVPKRRRQWLTMLGSLVLALSLNAGEKLFDFETDPFIDFPLITSTQTDLVWGGEFPDEAQGNPGRFLDITEATGSTSTTVVFPDIDNGKLVKAFTLTADVRVGNGVTDRPADGFSISFARAGDQLITDGTGFAAGLPEAGATTGVSVGFDAWQGNTLPDTSDIEGIIVRVDNKTVGKFSLPTRNGACDDITSIQTGPQGATADDRGKVDPLCWQKLDVSLNELGALTVKWKGATLLDGFQTGFFPSPGQLVLAGRTGGANEITHFDNVKLTTVLADKALISNFAATENSFAIEFKNFGASKVDESSISIKLDGVDVNVDVSTTGDTTSVSFAQKEFFAPASDHIVSITAKDTQGNDLSADVGFTAMDYTPIPAEFALDNVDTSKRGFSMRVVQSASGLANNIALREQHLAGLLTDADGNPLENIADDFGSENGVFKVDLINFDQDGNPAGEFRDLGDGSSKDVPDDFIPGIPGLEGGTDNISAEIRTVVEIPDAGLYTFGFNSDDGFKTTAGRLDDLELAINLGQFDGGRGAATTSFNVFFEKAGLYAMRSIWFEGGGGANLEWFTITPTEALLNDTANGGLRTFQDVPQGPLALKSLDPPDGATDISVTGTISATFENGSTSLDASSVSLKVAGKDVSAKVNGTTISYSPAEPLPLGTEIPVELTIKDSAGAERVVAWSFTTTLLGGNLMFIETEDFDFGKGNWDKSNPIGFTGKYPGGTYQDKGDGIDETDVNAGTDFGVDYFEVDSSSSQAIYRPDTGVEAGKMNGPAGFFRGDFDVETNHVVGWNDDGDWYNYTRSFPEPAQKYNVFGRLASGGSAIQASLSKVTSGVGTATQEVEQLGIWTPGRATAGWDSFEIFPLLAPGAAPGDQGPLAVVELGGATTLRLTTLPGNHDSDFFFFTPAKEPVAAGGITGVSVEGGNVVIEFTGTLKGADDVTGPFADVAGATSPFTVKPEAGHRFFIAQ